MRGQTIFQFIQWLKILSQIGYAADDETSKEANFETVVMEETLPKVRGIIYKTGEFFGTERIRWSLFWEAFKNSFSENSN